MNNYLQIRNYSKAFQTLQDVDVRESFLPEHREVDEGRKTRGHLVHAVHALRHQRRDRRPVDGALDERERTLEGAVRVHSQVGLEFAHDVRHRAVRHVADEAAKERAAAATAEENALCEGVRVVSREIVRWGLELLVDGSNLRPDRERCEQRVCRRGHQAR